MRILITGSNGLLGQNLSRLVPAGAEVMGVDLQERVAAPGVEHFRRLDLG